jgi:sulfite reductase alpha subunit-like flavoprotein
MTTHTEATFIRRKFTITEELDAELERMAENNYQGNVSLCLRQAITDHRETLRGNGDLTIRHLIESVAHIEDQVSDLSQSIDATGQTSQSQTNRSEATVVKADETGAMVSGANQVLVELEKANTPLRVADIIERVEMQPVDVRYALGSLVDHGHVFTTQEDTPRYHLATMQFDSPDQKESEGPRQ